VAADAVSAKHLSSARLARGLAHADTEDVRAHAHALGEKMAAERGLQRAVASIEMIMSG
jgi:hypothetical protein